MIRRVIIAGSLCTFLVVGAAIPAQAQDSVVSLNAGGWVVRGLDGRELDFTGDGTAGDVLANNLLATDFFLEYDVNDFNGFTFGGDYLISIGSFVEAGAGVAFYRRTVPTIDGFFQHADGRPILMDMQLRVVPITFTGRFFPIGRDGPIQPYVGAGAALMNWRYSETGEFVDFDTCDADLNCDIFADSFSGSGWSTAPVVLAGARFPVGESFLIGGEFRYHGGKADVDPFDPQEGFFGDHIDLTNYVFQVTFGFRF